MSTRARSYLRQNVLGLIAIFIALGGTAYAANTVGSSDIIDGEVKTNDLAANAVGSGKIADQQVKNQDLGLGASSSNTIADGGVQGIDVKDNTLKGADIDESTLSGIGGGTAGGDLTGTYPNPQIAPDVVGAGELAGISFFEQHTASLDDPPSTGENSGVSETLLDLGDGRQVRAICNQTSAGVVLAIITFKSASTVSDVDTSASNGDNATAVPAGNDTRLVEVGPTASRAVATGDYATFTGGDTTSLAPLTGHVAALTHSGRHDCEFVASGLADE